MGSVAEAGHGGVSRGRARPRSRCTVVFEDTCAWLVQLRMFTQAWLPQVRALLPAVPWTQGCLAHLRLLTRRAYGYRRPDSLITMADLAHGGPR